MSEKNGRPDADLPMAVAGAARVRCFARLTTLVVMTVCAVLGGQGWTNWLIGALLGGLVVDINLGLLLRTLMKAAEWKGRSLWPTLLKFYLTFGATVVVCILVVRNQWGHPLAFLLGLLSFFIGLSLGLVSLALKAPAGILGRDADADSPEEPAIAAGSSKSEGGRS